MNQLSPGQEIYRQIVNTWRFLHAGIAIDRIMQTTQPPTFAPFKFYGHEIGQSAVRVGWPNNRRGWSGESYFGSTIFFLSSREILSATVEGLKLKSNDEILNYDEYAKSVLSNSYESFNTLVKLCRNVLSHNYTSALILNTNDFEPQKKYLIKNNKDLLVALGVDYSNLFGANYSYQDKFKVEVDFSQLSDGAPFLEIFPEEKLLKLVILCGSLAECYIDERTIISLKEQIEQANKG